MTTIGAQSGAELIRRAYANLTGLRENLPKGLVHEGCAELLDIYKCALDELEEAGFDVNEWRIRTRLGELHVTVLRAKIDAALTYFTVQQKRVQIGFRN